MMRILIPSRLRIHNDPVVHIAADAACAILFGCDIALGENIHGIDNISYIGVAEPMNYSDLLTVEQLPTQFYRRHSCFH